MFPVFMGDKGKLIIIVTKDALVRLRIIKANLLFIIVIIIYCIEFNIGFLQFFPGHFKIFYFIILFILCPGLIINGILELLDFKRLSNFEIYENGFLLPSPRFTDIGKAIFIKYNNVEHLILYPQFPTGNRIFIRTIDNKRYSIESFFIKDLEIRTILINKVKEYKKNITIFNNFKKRLY